MTVRPSDRVVSKLLTWQTASLLVSETGQSFNYVICHCPWCIVGQDLSILIIYLTGGGDPTDLGVMTCTATPLLAPQRWHAV